MLMPDTPTITASTIHGKTGVTAYRMVNRAGVSAFATPQENSYVARYRPRRAPGPRSATSALAVGVYNKEANVRRATTSKRESARKERGMINARTKRLHDRHHTRAAAPMTL